MPFAFSSSSSADRLACWSSCSLPTSMQQLLELLLRRASVGAAQRDTFAHLPGETGDAHHEEFIEIGRRDRQEAHTFQQRMTIVLRFFQNTAVELQPRELAIDEPIRISASGLAGRGLALSRNSALSGLSSFMGRGIPGLNSLVRKSTS